MTYTLTLSGNNKIGYEAAITGIYQKQPAEVLAWSRTYVVLKSVGYNENPGSKYSGLMSYYPPEIDVYEIINHLSTTRLECQLSIGWDAGRGKNKNQVKLPT